MKFLEILLQVKADQHKTKLNCKNKINAMNKFFHNYDRSVCHYFCMLIPDQVFDTSSTAETVIICNYNSCVLRRIRISLLVLLVLIRISFQLVLLKIYPRCTLA